MEPTSHRNRQGSYMTVIYVAGPILITALALGLLIGVLQAATSIQEMTLSFIPKYGSCCCAIAFW